MDDIKIFPKNKKKLLEILIQTITVYSQDIGTGLEEYTKKSK